MQCSKIIALILALSALPIFLVIFIISISEVVKPELDEYAFEVNYHLSDGRYFWLNNFLLQIYARAQL